MRSFWMAPLFVLAFPLAAACSSSSSTGPSSSSGGVDAGRCDDTPLPTPGTTCTPVGTYTVVSTPRCEEDRCAEDETVPFDVEVTCDGNACKVAGNRSPGNDATYFQVECTLDGCGCRTSGGNAYVFDADGFVGEGPSVNSNPSGEGASCIQILYFEGTKK